MQLKYNFSFLIHNFLHPLAGIAWFFGKEGLGDAIHDSIDNLKVYRKELEEYWDEIEEDCRQD